MIINLEKRFKNIAIFCKLGFIGKYKFIGWKPYDWEKYKNDEDYIKSRYYYEDSYNLSLLPSISISTGNRIIISFCWIGIVTGFTFTKNK